MTSRQLGEEAIFHVARGISDSRLRSTYLDQVCAGDQPLRERVEAVLKVHEQEQGFLKSAPQSPVQQIGPIQPAATIDYRGGEASGQEVGRYKLRENLGEGGFGVVWAAEQVQSVRRKVALKRLLSRQWTRAS